MTRRRTWLAGSLAAVLCGAATWLYTPDLDRTVVEQRYLASRGDLRTIDGVTLHVRDSGPRDAPALVLLHGLGSSLHTWEPWALALRDRYRVIRFDFPGHGLSAPTSDYRDIRSHRLLRSLLDTLGIAQATVLGNSMGGRIAWSFAAAHPDRVRALVLMAPDGFASPGFEYDKPADVPAVLGAMRFVLPRKMLEANLAPAYADPSALRDSIVNRYYDLMRAPGNREALLARMRQTMLTDPVPRLRRITAPTLLLWGAQDAMIPMRNAQDYLRAMPNARLVTLPGLGHLPFEEAPARALPPVVEFLEAYAQR